MMLDAFFVALAVFVGVAGHELFGMAMLSRPIVVAPLAGLLLGDVQTGLIVGASLESIFMGVVNIGISSTAEPALAAGLAIGLANAGNVLAPLIFLLAFNIPNYLCRYYGAFLGYSLGAKYIEKIYSNGMMEILTKAAGIVGLIMVGAMTSKTVLFTTILDFTMKGKSVMDVQSSLDSIFIGIVPLLLTFGCFKLLKKKVNIIVLIFGIVALGIILSVLGIC